MAAPPALAQGATQAQALAYLNAFWGTATYRNSASTPYNGKDAAQLYAYVEQQQPTAEPYDIAVTVSDLLLSSAAGAAIGNVAGEATTAVGATGTGISTASFLPPWADGLAGFLSALGSAQLWIRVAKVIVGGGLVLIGVAHMTGASNAVASAARKVPLPV